MWKLYQKSWIKLLSSAKCLRSVSPRQGKGTSKEVDTSGMNKKSGNYLKSLHSVIFKYSCITKKST